MIFASRTGSLAASRRVFLARWVIRESLSKNSDCRIISWALSWISWFRHRGVHRGATSIGIFDVIVASEAAIDEPLGRPLPRALFDLIEDWGELTEVTANVADINADDKLGVGGRGELDIVGSTKTAVGHLHHPSLASWTSACATRCWRSSVARTRAACSQLGAGGWPVSSSGRSENSDRCLLIALRWHTNDYLANRGPIFSQALSENAF